MMVATATMPCGGVPLGAVSHGAVPLGAENCSSLVGETAVIGDNCTILHAVTLGGTGKERGDRHPKIGHACVLGAGATILGNIKVGDSATVGSQAVVTKDVPAGMTVVGLNKLLDPHFDAKRDSVVEKRPATWQYEVDTYDGYSI